MTLSIDAILEEIKLLENKLEAQIELEQEHVFSYIGDKKVIFEEHVAEKQRLAKRSLLKWLGNSKLRNILSAPFIYSMIFPLFFLHLFMEIYQAICFSLYNIPKVKRADYFVFDRHQLPYLNVIEKFNCAYCSYGNGLIAYVQEIIARTEKYWCPIKHARKALGTHKHYQSYLHYGEYENYHEKMKSMRESLQKTQKEQSD